MTGYVFPDGGITTEDGWIVRTDSMGCLIGGCNTSGIEQLESVNELNIYPNPANDFIDIETTGISDFQNSYFSIFDITGNLVTKEKMIQNKTRIDLSEFPNGLYLIQVRNNGKMFSKKFIKQ